MSSPFVHRPLSVAATTAALESTGELAYEIGETVQGKGVTIL